LARIAPVHQDTAGGRGAPKDLGQPRKPVEGVRRHRRAGLALDADDFRSAIDQEVDLGTAGLAQVVERRFEAAVGVGFENLCRDPGLEDDRCLYEKSRLLVGVSARRRRGCGICGKPAAGFPSPVGRWPFHTSQSRIA